MKLLIDGDILLYTLCSAAEVEINWGDDIWTLYSDAKEVKGKVKENLENLTDHLDADGYVFCLSDSLNFRKEIFPNYKGNRRGQRKPVAYKELKDWCLAELGAVVYPKLEADDVMGILATQNPGEYIICSDDKDLQQIPGAYFKGVKPTVGLKVEQITPADGMYYTFQQALTGDPTDGYPGCPGIGPVNAQKALLGAKWQGDVGKYAQALWNASKGLYAKAGLSEEDALVQLRCARILQVSDWDAEKQEIKLYTP